MVLWSTDDNTLLLIKLTFYFIIKKLDTHRPSATQQDFLHLTLPRPIWQSYYSFS
ncbi:hypothetical protein ALT785_770073 [Alteromonas infernus]